MPIRSTVSGDVFAAFHNGDQLNNFDLNRSPEDIGLDRNTRISGYGPAFQGQLGLRFRF